MKIEPTSNGSAPAKDEIPSVWQALVFSVKTMIILAVASQAVAYAIHSALKWEKRSFAERAIKAPANLLFFGVEGSSHRRRNSGGRRQTSYAVFDAFDGSSKRRITLEVEDSIPYQPGESLTLLIDPKDGDDVRLPETNKPPLYRHIAAIAFGVAYFFGFLICGAVIGTTFIANHARLRRTFKMSNKG